MSNIQVVPMRRIPPADILLAINQDKILPVRVAAEEENQPNPSLDLT